MIATLRWSAEALSEKRLWTDDTSDLFGAVRPIRARVVWK